MSFKKIYYLYLVHGLFNVTNVMVFTTYFLYLTNELHLSYSMAALLDLPVFLTQFVVELPSGFFADRFGLKKSVLIGVLALMLAPLFYVLTTNYVVLFLSGIVCGVGYAFISGALDALSYESFHSEIKKFMAIRQIMMNIANVIVPLITIWAAGVLGFRIFYLFDFVFKLVILCIVFFKIEDLKRVYEAPKLGLEFIRIGFASVRSQLKSSRAVFYQANSQFLWGITSVAVDMFFIKVIELSSGLESIGLVFAIASILAIVGNVIAYKLKIIKSAFWISFLLQSAFVILAGIFFGKSVGILFILGRSFFISLHEVLSSIVINEIVKVDRASMFSFFSFLTMIGKIIAILLVGALADSIGIGAVWILAGFILLVISWQLFQVQKNLDNID